MVYQPIIDQNHIAYYNGTEQEFIGRIVAEPDIRMGYVNYVVSSQFVILNKVKNLSVQKQTQTERFFDSAFSSAQNDINGKVQIKTKLYPQYNYGDYLQIKCKLKTPENFDDKFLYDKYLARYRIYSVCYYPTIVIPAKAGIQINEILDSHFRGNDKLFVGIKQKILSFKSIIADKIDQLWPEPQSSFMAGLLYGSRSGLPNDLTNNFNRTGVTHIIAISGYNISIIVVFVMTGLIYIGLYRQQAFWVTLIIIFLFVIFTGASASVVRAAIMGSIVLLSQYWGRISQVGNILLLTLVIMLIINPMVLLYDAGFQLSFLATVGLIYISPLLSNKNFLNRLPFNLSETIISTISAIIITLPLILYQFGRLSVVALIVNILILWIIPWLMLFGFIAVILSFILFPLAQMVAYLAGLGLNYVIMIINWFGHLSWSSIEINLPSWLMVLIYIFMLLIFVYEKKKKQII